MTWADNLSPEIFNRGIVVVIELIFGDDGLVLLGWIMRSARYSLS